MLQMPANCVARRACDGCSNPNYMRMCRRSAVSRQACQVVSALASVMGTRFEQVALQLVPQLFKMVVITVQVRVLVAIRSTWGVCMFVTALRSQRLSKWFCR